MKKCNFCNEEHNPIITGNENQKRGIYKEVVFIEDNKLVLFLFNHFYSGQSIFSSEIKFCPKCGKKLHMLK